MLAASRRKIASSEARRASPLLPFPHLGSWQTCPSQSLPTPPQLQPPGVPPFLHTCLSVQPNEHLTQGKRHHCGHSEGQACRLLQGRRPCLHQASSHRLLSSYSTSKLQVWTPQWRMTGQSSLLLIIHSLSQHLAATNTEAGTTHGAGNTAKA